MYWCRVINADSAQKFIDFMPSLQSGPVILLPLLDPNGKSSAVLLWTNSWPCNTHIYEHAQVIWNAFLIILTESKHIFLPQVDCQLIHWEGSCLWSLTAPIPGNPPLAFQPDFSGILQSWALNMEDISPIVDTSLESWGFNSLDLFGCSP